MLLGHFLYFSQFHRTALLLFFSNRPPPEPTSKDQKHSFCASDNVMGSTQQTQDNIQKFRRNFFFALDQKHHWSEKQDRFRTFEVFNDLTAATHLPT